MRNNKSSKRALIFENGDADYNDVCSCLPEDVEPRREPTKDKDIEIFGRKDYNWCICDLTTVEPIANGIPLDSPTVLDDLNQSINHISRLISHFLNCHFIIVTKLPVRYLRDHFNDLILRNDLDMKTVFDKDYINLPQKLNASKSLPFGVVYSSKKVHIVIKPYSTNNNEGSKDDIVKWKEDFKKIIKGKY